MSKHLVIKSKLLDMPLNSEQKAAVQEQSHCVVLAGPGSGKTKTLVTAIARSLLEDIIEPRGIACITYNNECVMELKIGTVHSFALTQVIMPYARFFSHLLPNEFRIANKKECDDAKNAAYLEVFSRQPEQQKWREAERMRRHCVDRTKAGWIDGNKEITNLILAYEKELRRRSLIDFDDMPLLAFRMIQENTWISNALRAKYPVLFVDEYQDLGHALHELVLLLCFDGGIRLFAVGDPDQSIYGFNGADPQLLNTLTERQDINIHRLLANYRSGSKIIQASLEALGEDRDYFSENNSFTGDLRLYSVAGDLATQADKVSSQILPDLLQRYPSEEIAICYREAWLGDYVSKVLDLKSIPYTRIDKNALIKRSSYLARFIEECAQWTNGGWKESKILFSNLLSQAKKIVFFDQCSDTEEELISRQLIKTLRDGINKSETANTWLKRLRSELIIPWKGVARNPQIEWEICDFLIKETNPDHNKDIDLSIFAGQAVGRITLSTLHSVKGREFDAVILFGLNDDILPKKEEKYREIDSKEARRLFYVGVTRARKELVLVCQSGKESPFIQSIKTPIHNIESSSEINALEFLFL